MIFPLAYLAWHCVVRESYFEAFRSSSHADDCLFGKEARQVQIWRRPARVISQRHKTCRWMSAVWSANTSRSAPATQEHTMISHDVHVDLLLSRTMQKGLEMENRRSVSTSRLSLLPSYPLPPLPRSPLTCLQPPPNSPPRHPSLACAVPPHSLSSPPACP